MLKERLKKFRIACNYSQEQMAEILNCPYQTISKYERGIVKPSSDLLTKFILKFNLDVNWLLTGKGSMFQGTSRNTLERRNNKAVYENAAGLGRRLQEIQDRHNFLDREMAILLKISEKDYMKLKLGKLQPDLDILNEIKRNFVVDIDWLIYGT